MNIKEYINSGILEIYVLGAANESETQEVLHYKELYPEVKNALEELESDIELIAETMAIKPPPHVWDRIDTSIEGLVTTKPQSLRISSGDDDFKAMPNSPAEKYIEIEASSTYMRIHKAWRWIFAAVFVLSKIFLILAIYYYLENRHAQDQIKDLKAQVKEHTVK